MMVNRNHTITGFLMLLVLLVSSCAAPPARVEPGALKKRPQPKIVTAALEKQIHSLINKERRKQGLSLLEWDDALSGIAQKHSRDMAARNYFDHYSPEGRDFSYRYQQGGYQCVVRTGGTVYMGAENIALNYLYDSVTTVNGRAYYDWNTQDKIAETTVRGWMKSRGHRKNILTPYFKHEGIGVIIAPDDRVYITQNF
ncbi:MAG TPA: CAP domain-containing protein, partial [Nitrospirota bacterium]|nr:CAP domain-containing protein [Nitrospirota bacterium]